MASVIRSTRLLASRGVRMLQTRNYADEALKLTLASANKVFYDAVDVKQVDVPSFSGDFGILATHVPTLGKHHPTAARGVVLRLILSILIFDSRFETGHCHRL